MLRTVRSPRSRMARALALSAFLLGAALAAHLPGCSSSDSSGAGGSFAVVYLRGAPAFTALDTGGAPALAVTEVWLAPISVRLYAASGQKVAIPLNDVANLPDLLSLTPTASLFAYGNFPAGEYSGVEIVLGAAASQGVVTGTSTPAHQALVLATGGSYLAPFAAPITITALSTSFVVDWPPSISSNAAHTVFTLNGGTAVTHVLGGSQAGDPATISARDLLGLLVTQNCVTGNLQVETGNGAIFPVSTTASTDFLDHEDPTPSFVLCTDIQLGDVVLVKGEIQPSGAQLGSSVRVVRRVSLPAAASRTQFKGVIRDIIPNGNVGVQMLVAQGDIEVGIVLTDGRSTAINGGTIIEGEDGTPVTFTALAVGQHIRAVASFVTSGSTPPVANVTDVVVVEQP